MPLPTTSEDQVLAARAAYAGDVDQALHLISLLPNAKRGEEVAAAYRARIPVPAFREMLSSAWEGDYDEVLRAAGHREDATLRKWFVYANFDLTHIPDHVTACRLPSPPWPQDSRAGIPRTWCERRQAAAAASHAIQLQSSEKCQGKKLGCLDGTPFEAGRGSGWIALSVFVVNHLRPLPSARDLMLIIARLATA